MFQSRCGFHGFSALFRNTDKHNSLLSYEFNNSHFPRYPNYAPIPSSLLFSPKSHSFVHRPPFITSGQNSCGNHSFREIVFPHKRETRFPFRNRKIFLESSYHRTSGKITLQRFFPNTISPRKSFSLRLFHRQ